MNAPTKLAGFAVALSALTGAGALAGSAVDPDRRAEPEEHHAAASAPAAVRGLAVADDGLRLEVDTPEIRRGTTTQLRFRIVGDDGHTVRRFDVGHERRMHAIVARRDLTGFQHLHPRRTPDGTWVVDLTLASAGSYRLFADFVVAGRPRTLASDLRVDGPADLRPLPAPTSRAVSDGGDDVELIADAARPGAPAVLRFAISREGRPVRTEPYLGAGGHLVALREGDLAFLHVHPMDEAADGSIGFAATFPSAGRYRLFLQFKDRGQLHTAAFTQEVR